MTEKGDSVAVLDKLSNFGLMAYSRLYPWESEKDKMINFIFEIVPFGREKNRFGINCETDFGSRGMCIAEKFTFYVQRNKQREKIHGYKIIYFVFDNRGDIFTFSDMFHFIDKETCIEKCMDKLHDELFKIR